MIPQLYTGGAPIYPLTHRIHSIYNATSAVVTNEVNGEYILEIQVPVGATYWDVYRRGQVITAQVDDTGDIQKFVIAEISGGTTGLLTILAEHVSYHYAKVCASPFGNGGVYGGPKWAFETAFAQTSYKPLSARTTYSRATPEQGSAHLLIPKPLREYYLVDLLDSFGGEFKFDNLNVLWADRIGTHIGDGAVARAIYGKNIISIDVQSSTTAVPYRIYPYWGELGSDKGYAELSSKFVVVPGVMDEATFDLAVDVSARSEGKPSETELYQIAQDYIADEYSSPTSQSLTIQTIPVEGEDPVVLGDDIYVRALPLGIDGTYEVKKMTYDVLHERVIQIEAGARKETLADYVLSKR